jgi:hypothetical protein
VGTRDRLGTMPRSEPMAAAWFGAAHGAGGLAGDPDQQRQGSFGDVDRVVIVTYDDDAERARVTGLRGSGGSSTGPRPATPLWRAVNELHRGRAVVLVDVREIAAGEARDQREQLPRAA